MTRWFREMLLARRARHFATFQADAINRIDQQCGLGNTSVSVYAIIPHTDDPVQASAYQEWLHQQGFEVVQEPTAQDFTWLRSTRA